MAHLSKRLSCEFIAPFGLACVAVTLALGTACNKPDPLCGDYVIEAVVPEDAKPTNVDKFLSGPIGKLRIEANAFTMTLGDTRHAGTWKREGGLVKLLYVDNAIFVLRPISNDLLVPVEGGKSDVVPLEFHFRRQK